MVLLMQLTQAFSRNVRINLGSREIAVSQQHLYDTQIGAVVQQMGRKGMAHHMRR